MDRNKILYIADAHIARRTWANSTALAGDAYEALHKILDVFDAKGDGRPETLVIGGDWFDTNRPTSTDLLETLKFLRNFKNVFYLRGNHDSIKPSFLEADIREIDITGFIDTVGMCGTTTEFSGLLQDMSDIAGEDGVYMAGLPWYDSADALRENVERLAGQAKELAGLRRLNVFLHAAFHHLLGIDGMWQLTGDWVANAFKDLPVSVYVGHVHTRDTRTFGGVTVHSPGSLYPRSWDKVLQSSCASLIDVVTGDIEDIPCDCRQYYEIPWTGQAEFDAFMEQAAPDFEPSYLKPFVRIVLPTDCTDKPRIPPTVDHQVVRQRNAELVEERVRLDAATIEQAVAEECGDREDLKDMALALLASDDPVAELDRWFTLWGVTRL